MIPNLQPLLVGKTLTLRPMQIEDFEVMFEAASDPKIWELHPNFDRYQRPVFEAFFKGGMASLGALTVIDTASSKVVGSSRYYDWDAANEEVAIGFTFLARSHWGGTANAEMKQLMLSHAFGFVKRVWFHVGPGNIRSRRAMEKIGGRLSHQGIKEMAGTPVEYVFYKIDRP